jgi:hypothetical protein
MINVKRFFYADADASNMTLSVRRVADGFYLQSADGSFDSSLDFLAMTEADSSGGYSLDENREAWINGIYDVVFYNTGAVSPGAGYEFQVVQDQIMTGVSLTALAAKTAVSQIAAGLKSVNDTIAAQAKQISLLTGQVNDYTSQARRANGS